MNSNLLVLVVFLTVLKTCLLVQGASSSSESSQYLITTLYDLDQNTCNKQYYFSGIANLVGVCYESSMVVAFPSNNSFSFQDFNNPNCTGEPMFEINYSLNQCYIHTVYTLVDNWQIPEDNLIIASYNAPCSTPMSNKQLSQVYFYPTGQCRTLANNNTAYQTCSDNDVTTYYYSPSKPSTSIGSTGTLGSGTGSTSASATSGSESQSSGSASSSASSSASASASASSAGSHSASSASSGSGTSGSKSSATGTISGSGTSTTGASSEEHQCPGYNYEKIQESFPSTECLQSSSTYTYCN